MLFNNSVALTLSPCVSLIPFDLGTELTEYNCQSVYEVILHETCVPDHQVIEIPSLGNTIGLPTFPPCPSTLGMWGVI